MKMKNKIQLDAQEYYILNKGKNSIPLFIWITYWYQLNSIINLNPEKILEIWVGSNMLSSTLKLNWYDITTFDHDPTLKPDFVWDIIDLPFEKDKFDTIACFEVIEHIPFEDSITALKELYRVSSKNVIISIPYSCFYLNFSLGNFYCSLFKGIYSFFWWIPHEPRTISFKMPFFFLTKTSCEYHYWELWQKWYSKKTFNKIIEWIGFKIKKTFHNPFYPYHYYIILEKNESSIKSE